MPIVPVYRGDQLQGFVFLNSDFANSVGYSGKPIHLLAGIDPKVRAELKLDVARWDGFKTKAEEEIGKAKTFLEIL